MEIDYLFVRTWETHMNQVCSSTCNAILRETSIICALQILSFLVTRVAVAPRLLDRFLRIPNLAVCRFGLWKSLMEPYDSRLGLCSTEYWSSSPQVSGDPKFLLVIVSFLATFDTYQMIRERA